MLLSLSKWNSTVALEIPLIRKGTAAKVKFIWTNEMEKEYNTQHNKEYNVRTDKSHTSC